MIELYYGNGKGKTTAAVGLTIRAAGHHVPVLFVQFLKDGKSGELNILRQIDEVEILTEKGLMGFYKNMSDDEKKKAKDEAERIYKIAEKFALDKTNDNESQAKALKKNKATAVNNIAAGSSKNNKIGSKIFIKPENNAEIKRLVVLDEVLHAVHFGLIEEKDLLDFLKKVPRDVEVVLTGRSPSQQIINASDYATEFRKEKHPFDRGVKARTGVEM